MGLEQLLQEKIPEKASPGEHGAKRRVVRNLTRPTSSGDAARDASKRGRQGEMLAPGSLRTQRKRGRLTGHWGEVRRPRNVTSFGGK